jgi:hypothetical protein
MFLWVSMTHEHILMPLAVYEADGKSTHVPNLGTKWLVVADENGTSVCKKYMNWNLIICVSSYMFATLNDMQFKPKFAKRIKKRVSRPLRLRIQLSILSDMILTSYLNYRPTLPRFSRVLKLTARAALYLLISEIS